MYHNYYWRKLLVKLITDEVKEVFGRLIQNEIG